MRCMGQKCQKAWGEVAHGGGVGDVPYFQAGNLDLNLSCSISLTE